MLIALWIINVLLALAFLAVGSMKAFRPFPALKAVGMTWIDDFPPVTVRLIGTAEIVGAVGLIVPILTGIAPMLTPVAASALAVLMVGAIVVHARRKESAIPAIVLAVLTAGSAVLGFVVLAG